MATNKDKIRAAAQKYLQKGQIDKAIREFERLVEDDPNDVRTLLKIGDLQTRKGDQAAATVTYGNVAKYYSDQGFFLKAVAVYKQILKLDPALVDVNLRLAELYHQLGLMSDAIAQYRLICEIYEKTERWDDCQNVLTKMLELEPNNLAARIKLAETHARAGRTEQSKTDFARAAQQLKSENRLDDYIKVAERMVHVDPNDMATMRELAAIYIEKNDARKALAKLQVCFRANPKEVETLTLLSRAFEDLGQLQKAVSVLKELAEVHAGAGNQQARQATLRKIALLDPETAAEAGAMPSPSASSRDGTVTTTGVMRPPPRPGVPSAPASSAAPATPAPKPVVRAPPAQELIAEIEEVSDEAEEVEEGLEAEPLSAEEEAALAAPEDLNKLLVEADIYIKYGLRNKAIDHLERVLALQPNHREAQERYKNVLLDADDTAGACARLWDMAQAALSAGNEEMARGDLQELLQLDPQHAEARAMQRKLEGEPEAAKPAAAAKPAKAAEEEAELPGVELETDLLVETGPPRPRKSVEVIDDTAGAELAIEVEADAFMGAAAGLAGSSGSSGAAEEEEEIAVELDTDVLMPSEPAPPAPQRQPGVQLQATPPSDSPRPRGEAALPRGGTPVNPLAGLPITRPQESAAKPAAKAPEPAKPTPRAAEVPTASKGGPSLAAFDLDEDVVPAAKGPAKSPPSASSLGGGGTLELDLDLDEDTLAGPAPVAAKPAAKPGPSVSISALDLDEATAAPGPSKAAPSPSISALDLDLDDALAPAPTKPAARPAPSANALNLDDFVTNAVPSRPAAKAPVLTAKPAAGPAGPTTAKPATPAANAASKPAAPAAASPMAASKPAAAGGKSNAPAAMPAAAEAASAKPAAKAPSAKPAAVAVSLDDLPAKIPSYALPPSDLEPQHAPEVPAGEEELDLRAELDEVEFFLQQGLTDEAEEALGALVTFYPDHSGVVALQQRMAGGGPAAAEDEPEPETVHIARVDADLQEELDHTPDANNDDFGISFEDVFDQFKKGVAQQVDQEDYDTHYNLGIAYKEMGLLEDAIREFELVSKAPQLEINALMMMGLCNLERGSTDQALRCFMQGLGSPRVTAREVVALRYEVGLAYESMGRYADAVKFYEKASAMDPTFRDVTNRLNEALQHVDEGPAASSGELDALLGDSPTRKNAKISYL